jgi:hypothetical protein
MELSEAKKVEIFRFVVTTRVGTVILYLFALYNKLLFVIHLPLPFALYLPFLTLSQFV